MVVFPRPSAHDSYRSSFPVEVDAVMLRSKFDLRLSDAAKSFGISITSFKHVCRKLGIERWPRRLRPRTAHQMQAASSSSGSTKDMGSTPPDSLHSGSGDDYDGPNDSRSRKLKRSQSLTESLSTDSSSSGGALSLSQSDMKRGPASPAYSKRRRHDALVESVSHRDDTTAFLDADFAHCSLPTPATAPPKRCSLQMTRSGPVQQLLTSMGHQASALHHLIVAASAECSANADRSMAQNDFAALTACSSLQPNAPFSTFSAKSTSMITGHVNCLPLNTQAQHQQQPMLFHAAIAGASLPNACNQSTGTFAARHVPTSSENFFLATGNPHFTNRASARNLNVGHGNVAQHLRAQGISHGSGRGVAHGSVNGVHGDKKLDEETMQMHLASLQALHQQTQFPSLRALTSEVDAN